MNPTLVQIPVLDDAEGCWLAALAVREGQAVQLGQLLARLETKGASYALVSPVDGYIVGLHAVAGQFAHTQQVLCYICSQPSLPAMLNIFPSTNTPRDSFDPTAIVVFGGGGHGKTVIDLLRATGAYRIVGVIDDSLPTGSDVLGAVVLGGTASLNKWIDRGVRLAANAVGGIGNVDVRIRIFDLLAKAGFSFPTLIHPSAVIERSAVLEAGVQVLAQAYVGSTARIGFGSLLNAGAIVSHDGWLGKIVNLSPGATLAGNVTVEDYAQIGMRATVNVQVRVGARARLGNGCTVKADVPPGTRVYAGTIWPVRNERPEKQSIPKEES